MDKKKKRKIIISIALFILGSFTNIYIASYTHILLTVGPKNIELMDLFESIKVITNDARPLKLFSILEFGNILFSLLFFTMKDSFYESELMEITPEIKIPIPAGQGQFGSARFMTVEEAKSLFTVNEIKATDKIIKDLLRSGKEDIKNIKKI